jgi:hypothetical protein
MPRLPTTPFPLPLAAALATALLADRPARAGIILAVGDPEQNGVMAWDGTLEDFGAASDSPAHANAGNGHSSLHTFGSEISLGFEVSGKALASTGFGPPDIDFGGIPMLIEGTSGEAAESPVIVTLQAGGKRSTKPRLHRPLRQPNALFSEPASDHHGLLGRRPILLLGGPDGRRERGLSHDPDAVGPGVRSPRRSRRAFEPPTLFRGPGADARRVAQVEATAGSQAMPAIANGQSRASQRVDRVGSDIASPGKSWTP